jgi:molybdopterin-guanine dinucleotide biosynthesis protein A
LSVGSIVLAGGRSSRLGKEKHSEVISGRSIIERVLDRIHSVSDETLLVISRRQSATAFSYPGVKTVFDLYPDKGALGGIYTGLVYSGHSRNMVVACDMPFLNGELLRYMIDLAAGFDIVIPRVGELTEPLHAVYSNRCVGPMEKQMKEGDLRIAHVFGQVRVRYVEEQELDAFDPNRVSFFNVNTREDLDRARAMLG